MLSAPVLDLPGRDWPTIRKEFVAANSLRMRAVLEMDAGRSAIGAALLAEARSRHATALARFAEGFRHALAS